MIIFSRSLPHACKFLRSQDLRTIGCMNPRFFNQWGNSPTNLGVAPISSREDSDPTNQREGPRPRPLRVVVVLQGLPALAPRAFASHLWPPPKQQGNRASLGGHQGVGVDGFSWLRLGLWVAKSFKKKGWPSFVGKQKHEWNWNWDNDSPLCNGKSDDISHLSVWRVSSACVETWRKWSHTRHILTNGMKAAGNDLKLTSSALMLLRFQEYKACADKRTDMNTKAIRMHIMTPKNSKIIFLESNLSNLLIFSPAFPYNSDLSSLPSPHYQLG